MIDNIFIPLSSLKLFDQTRCQYIISALVEYIYSLQEIDLPISIYLQSFCLRLMTKTRSFQYMQMMLQYQSFNDSLEIAKDLVYAGNNGHTNAFQYAIDMYHRLKRPNDVIKILLLNEKVREVLLYVEQFKVKGVRIKDIFEVVQRLSENARQDFVDYFIKANVRFS